MLITILLLQYKLYLYYQFVPSSIILTAVPPGHHADLILHLEHVVELVDGGRV